MEQDKTFPAKWVKWHQLWGAAVTQNRRAAYGYVGSIACWALGAYLFIIAPLTLPYVTFIGMLAFLGGVGWKDAKFQRWRFLKDDGMTSGIYKPRWQRMGGYDLRPPDDVVYNKRHPLINEAPWVEKGYENTIRTDSHSQVFETYKNLSFKPVTQK